MSGYISPPLDTSPASIIDDALVYIETQLPGWQAAPGGIDTLIIEALAEPASETNDLASAALTAVFRYFGKLVNVLPVEAGAATVSALFTLRDNAGYTIPGGSAIGLRDGDGELWGFELVDDLVVAPGATTGSATLIAEIVGTAANGLSGDAELVTMPGFVTSAFVASPSDDGVDPEDDATYLDRLAETLTLLAPRPILPSDFAVMAQSVAGVWRAAAVDLLKPGPPYTGTAESSPVAESITVAVTDSAGADPGLTVRNAAQTYLASLREQNANIYVVAPQYETLDVTVTVKAMPGEDVSDLQSRVQAAIADYLSPVTWGSGGKSNQRAWLNDPVVRLSGLAGMIENVEGVRFIPTGSLTFGAHGGSLGTADVTMGAGSLIPALPLAGTITVTVTA